jgi:hypothetical protein
MDRPVHSVCAYSVQFTLSEIESALGAGSPDQREPRWRPGIQCMKGSLLHKYTDRHLEVTYTRTAITRELPTDRPMRLYMTLQHDNTRYEHQTSAGFWECMGRELGYPRVDLTGRSLWQFMNSKTVLASAHLTAQEFNQSFRKEGVSIVLNTASGPFIRLRLASQLQIYAPVSLRFSSLRLCVPSATQHPHTHNACFELSKHYPSSTTSDAVVLSRSTTTWASLSKHHEPFDVYTPANELLRSGTKTFSTTAACPYESGEADWTAAFHPNLLCGGRTIYLWLPFALR